MKTETCVDLTGMITAEIRDKGGRDVIHGPNSHTIYTIYTTDYIVSIYRIEKLVPWYTIKDYGVDLMRLDIHT